MIPDAVSYEAVIGLEVHVELNTETKVFCPCPTTFGATPNTQVCPVCLGLPGVLPVLNRKAVEFAIMAALALNCRVAPRSKFDRKNYFYPDLPKDYQISQYDMPLAHGGYVEISLNGGIKRIGIRRIHLEEDTGKLVHDGVTGGSLVDYNRSGVPLLEIVSEPDMRTPEEARAYLEKLRSTLQYTGISDCKMEEGSLRCDANVSIRPKGSDEWGTLTEIKNMNSFRSVKLALEYEIKRQTELARRGERIVRETRHWDEARGVTFSSRSKEEAHDYRYFPDPDLVPLEIDGKWVDEIRARLPELPDAKKRRFMDRYSLPEYDAEVLTSSRELAEFYERCVELFPDPKGVSNWVMGEVLRVLNARNEEIQGSKLSPEMLADMLKLIRDGTISGKIGKELIEEMMETGERPQKIIEGKGLVQISDRDELRAMIEGVIESNPSVVEDYRKGKEKALGFLVGQVMKLTRGRANPQLVNELLLERLKSI